MLTVVVLSRMNWHPQSQFSMYAEASDLSLRKLRLWKSKGVVTESNEAFDWGNPSKGELEIRKLYRPSSMSKRDIAKLDFPKMEMANYFNKEEVLCFHRIMQINKEPKSRNPFPSHCLQIGTHDMTIQCRKCNCRTSFCLDCHSEAPAMDGRERCFCRVIRRCPRKNDLSGHVEATRYDCRKAAIRFAVLKLKLPVVAYNWNLPEWGGPRKKNGMHRDHLKLSNGRWLCHETKRSEGKDGNSCWQIQTFPITTKEACDGAYGRDWKSVQNWRKKQRNLNKK